MDERGDRLAEFLRERDEPCPACGYSLRGLKAVVCPECGVGLRIGVVAERDVRVWGVCCLEDCELEARRG